ncbi:uncharacterized protein LOC144822994 [Lissotriton helveticus]
MVLSTKKKVPHQETDSSMTEVPPSTPPLSSCTALQVWSAHPSGIPLPSPATTATLLKKRADNEVIPSTLVVPEKLLDSDEEGSYEDENFGVARSPSDLRIKIQDGDTEEDMQETEPLSQENRPASGMPMPEELFRNLQFMLSDYYRCFPPSESGDSRVSTPRPMTTTPLSKQTQPVESEPREQERTTLPMSEVIDPQTGDEYSDNEEQEEGELDNKSESLEYEDYNANTPSPAEPTSSESPPVDIASFHKIMDRATKRFLMPMESKQDECFLYDFKSSQQKQSWTIPIIEFIWKEGLKIMSKPNSLPAALPRVDKKYRAPNSAPACLIGQAKADSVVEQAAQKRSSNPSAQVSVPPDKDGKRLDSIGKKVSTIAATTIKVANSLAILGIYERQMWSDILPYVEKLPEPDRAEAKKILQEGECVSSEMIDAAVDVAATGFRQLAGAAVLRRQGWLRATSFRQEVQSRILDMAYDGEHLFGKHLDDALEAIKKDTDTARSLGTLQYRKSSFRGTRGRGNFSNRGNYNQQRSYTSTQGNQRYQPYRQQNYGQRRGNFSQSRGKTNYRGRDSKK